MTMIHHGDGAEQSYHFHPAALEMLTCDINAHLYLKTSAAAVKQPELEKS